jgi:Protein of unknown function (DUF2796)
MRTFILLALGLGLIGHPDAAAAQHRHSGAHEHGRSTLNIAIEGTRISLELEAPGADIVGFEHNARTARQQAAIEQAKKQLLAPQALFKFPSAAGCVVAAASVDIEGGEHGHDQPRDKATAQKKADAADERSHSHFRGQYAFTCTAPAGITVLEFGYFQAFAGAQKLEVNVITPKGQTRFEVTRAKARISLAGLM